MGSMFYAYVMYHGTDFHTMGGFQEIRRGRLDLYVKYPI
jgi:hypothetical protein